MRHRPTSADVGRLAGVSRATVSFVLNERDDIAISPDTRERVRRAADALGYLPNALAAQLARGTSLAIGLVLRQASTQMASDALLPETVRGLSETARQADYEVVVEAVPPGSGGCTRLLQSHRVGGLILSGPLADDEELTRLCAENHPVVLQGHVDGARIPSVDVDNVAGARAAAAHLIGRGHRRIAMITNAPLTYTSASERVAGYRQALDEHGVTHDPRLVVEGSFEARSGFAAMSGLLDRGGFTAVFVASDVVALGAMRAIRAAGLRVPDDLSIVGFDDIPLAAHFDPPLTTVSVPAYELGRAAGAVVLARIRGEPVPERTLVGTVLMVRESVGGAAGWQVPREREDVVPSGHHVIRASGAEEEARAWGSPAQGGFE